jgi:hypothetical protein
MQINHLYGLMMGQKIATNVFYEKRGPNFEISHIS